MRAVEADARSKRRRYWEANDGGDPQAGSGNAVKLALAWTFVGIPLVWGIVQTLVNAIKAFH